MRALRAVLLLSSIWAGMGCGGLLQRIQTGDPGPVVAIGVLWDGAEPAAVEQGVVLPIEDALIVVPGVEHVTTTARDGAGEVVVRFSPGVAVDEALLSSRDALAGLIALPETAERPVIQLAIPRPGGVLRVQLAGADTPALAEAAGLLAEDIVRWEGVIAAVPSLQMTPDIQLQIDRQRAAAVGLSMQDILQQVSDAGFPEGEPEEYAALLIRLSSGEVIPLGQLAEIALTLTPSALSRADGQRVAWVDVRAADVAEIAARLARQPVPFDGIILSVP